jgi:molybdenum cofactor synthesis domain-containing protein
VSARLRAPIRATVVTVSDSASRGEAPDTAGPAVTHYLQDKLSCEIADAVIVSDDEMGIVDTLTRAVSADVDLVVTVGGTGCAPRDVTPEATRRVITREVPGIGEAMRDASAAVHPNARLSRAVAGIAGATLIVNVPGSERGAVENLAAIAALIPHAVNSIRGHARHPEADARRHR